MKYPKTLFVKRESGGTGPDYFNPCASALETAEMGEVIQVGVYTLTETIEVKGVAITSTVKRRAKR